MVKNKLTAVESELDAGLARMEMALGQMRTHLAQMVKSQMTEFASFRDEPLKELRK